MTRRPAALLWAVAIGAVLLRLAAAAYTHAADAPPEENRLIARNLMAGRGFTFTEFGVTGPTAVRGPAYPMLLAVLGPDRVKLALAVNALAGAATVFAAFALTKRLLSPLPCTHGGGLGRGSFSSQIDSYRADPLPNPPPAYREREPDARSPWCAAVLFAVWPTQLYAATLTQGLSIAVLLTLTSLAIAVRRTPPAAIAAGLLAGVAALTEPVLALPLLLAAFALGWRRGRAEAALFVMAGLVVVSPWLYRNAVVFGRPMPITSNFWRDVFLGNGPDIPISQRLEQTQGPAGRKIELKSPIVLLPASEFDELKRTEPDRIGVMRGWALNWIRHHPADYAARCVKRVFVVLFAQYERRSTFEMLYSLIGPLLVVFASVIALPSFPSGFRSVIGFFLVGLILPAAMTVAERRLVPMLDVPLLLAGSAGMFCEKPSSEPI